MKTQIELAREGVVTPQMEIVARNENSEPGDIRRQVALGEVVIAHHPQRKHQRVVGIGSGLRTKVNGSIGTSSDICDIDLEVKKARAVQEEGADTLMELSAGGDLDAVRRAVLADCDLPVGNVPLYQAFCEAARKYRNPNKLDPEYLFELIERQLADGISFMAIHCGINQFSIERLKKQGFRYGGLVSKGGTFMVSWMEYNQKENPLYEQFDRVCALMKKYDAVLSLGNGIRAGAIHDSHDRAQMAEMIINCELAELGREMGCQMMVEGPGHVPLDEIAGNIMLEKRMSGNAPYYVLGPLPADCGAGYDHVTAAIGAANAARHGADLICYITPAEHLALPNEADVREGVRITRLAVHIGDVAKYPKRREQEKQVSLARRDTRWEDQLRLLMFPDRAEEIRKSRSPENEKTCTMCGNFCAMERGLSLFEKDIRGDKISLSL
ncbi:MULTISPECIES: phosphomethylpyrimidine synthase ThiC [Desulfococcus]|uniref:Phosphomethylpyrimidine synthase n=1 Tax=Desulfococcus multivorans DSM 2059 TaxID=1121405 RepID=S7TRV5_DESML|nr:phosphomethylpyrimidine synthase ThiC [Desulfococcus multivorans]AOY60587.1 ThiC2: thiamine biosynthesis protein [Desulfococcus multivorans]AQV02682.1 phosphomethylpyrimidine synthase [Desulfococcus multivorans]EPR39706.1 Phosphomethylpyrimidine synthase [Desulfococcus multivorans DSM 2059]SKA04445.1 phosphomethylpyrimidine synthase [Desulfococcus multivorans DSM 2059]